MKKTLHAVSHTQKVGRRNLVLRPSAPHFPPNFGGIACCSIVAELNVVLLPRHQIEEMEI